MPKKLIIPVLTTLFLLSGVSSVFAAEQVTQGCDVTIPEETKVGDLMIVFAKGPEGTTATDWRDDGGGGLGWRQLGFSDITRGRDVNTAIFYKRKTDKNQSAVFNLKTHQTNVVCTFSSFVDSYYYNDSLRNNDVKSTDSSNQIVVTLEEHPEGQATNIFSFKNKKNAIFFRFALSSSSSVPVLGSIQFDLSNIQGVTVKKIKNIILYKDVDKNAQYTQSLDQFIGLGSVSIGDGATGIISFSDLHTPINGTYLVTIDTHALRIRDRLKVSVVDMNIHLEENSDTTLSIEGEVSNVLHRRKEGNGPSGIIEPEDPGGQAPPPPGGGGQDLPPGG